MLDFLFEHWRVRLGVVVMLLVTWRISRKPITDVGPSSRLPLCPRKTLHRTSDLLPDPGAGTCRCGGQPQMESGVQTARGNVPVRSVMAVVRCAAGSSGGQEGGCSRNCVNGFSRLRLARRCRTTSLTPHAGFLTCEVIEERAEMCRPAR